MRVLTSLLSGLSAAVLISQAGIAQTDGDEGTSGVPQATSTSINSADGSAPLLASTSAPVVEASSAPVPRPIDTMSRAAAVYGTYHGDVSDVREKPFSSVGDIEGALTSLGAQDSDQLSRGWLAYSALVASQSEEFRASVRDIEGFYGRDRVLLGLRNDFTYAGTLDGGTEAVNAAISALDTDTKRIDIAAAYVKEQAYTLQSAGWAKSKVGSRKKALLASLGQGRSVDTGLMQALASDEGAQALAQAGQAGSPSLWEGVQSAAQTIRFPLLDGALFNSGHEEELRARQDIANRINTLAAYRLLGIEGQDANQLQTALADPASERCMIKAQLNLQQCVAAVHQQHEVPFCISEHALAEISECMDVVTD